MPRTLDDFDVIPEERIRSMAATSGLSGKNSFTRLLKIADEWREAGCTPVFIIADDREEDMVIGCVAEETFGRYLN
jgi:hypothetical protein